MIEITKTNEFILLNYYSEQPIDWLDKKIESFNSHTIKGVFTVSLKNLHKKVISNDAPLDESYFSFIIGIRQKDYYEIDKEVFSIDNCFFFDKDIDLKVRHFYADDRISILNKIDQHVSQPVYIGGANEHQLPIEEFEKLIRSFPSTYEIKLYRDAKVSNIIKDYFDGVKDYVETYKTYINKKSIKPTSKLQRLFQNAEVAKYQTIYEKMDFMLKNEISYSEREWQKEIIQIMLILYPKYLTVFEEVVFRDTYSNKVRRLDFGLIDYNGNIDVVEIKIPFDKSIVSKNLYRDNYIPNRELSGAIMQIEKYIFYLNKAGKKEEQKLTEKYKKDLPQGLDIKITNPKGIIIMGRDNEMNENQKRDFEIIKRKYNNIIDVFTYDELLKRMSLIISQLKII